MIADECYAGSLSGYIIDNSPCTLPKLFTGMVHFFVALFESGDFTHIGSGENRHFWVGRK